MYNNYRYLQLPTRLKYPQIKKTHRSDPLESYHGIAMIHDRASRNVSREWMHQTHVPMNHPNPEGLTPKPTPYERPPGKFNYNSFREVMAAHDISKGMDTPMSTKEFRERFSPKNLQHARQLTLSQVVSRPPKRFFFSQYPREIPTQIGDYKFSTPDSTPSYRNT